MRRIVQRQGALYVPTRSTTEPPLQFEASSGRLRSGGTVAP